MNYDKILSIVVLTYNHEKYITQTLDSILNQKHNYPYEIIVGDDYSTDHTRKILLDYKKMYHNNITLLFNENNLGLIKNYFNCIKHCSGKYIMECAGDDYWLPGKVIKQVSLMERQSNIKMCYGKARVYNYQKGIYTGCIGTETITAKELLEENGIPALTVCLRSEFVHKYIKEIDPVSKNWKTEDYPMWLWFSKNGNMFFINECLAIYRVFENSLSHPRKYNDLKVFLNSIFNIKLFFSELYKESFDTDKNKLYISNTLLAQAIIEKNYFAYKEQIKNIKIGSIKDKIKKYVGNSYLLFILFCFLSILKKKGSLFIKIMYRTILPYPIRNSIWRVRRSFVATISKAKFYLVFDRL